MKEKVSVIIPIYNVSTYLEECLESIIRQTYKNLEIICVNDGSTDNSLKIIDEYAKKDKRIVVINKQNGGVSSARNAGLKKATGDFITFVDSDDYLEVETIETLYNKMQESKADIVRGNYFINNAKRQEEAKERIKECNNRIIEKEEIKEKVLIKILNGDIKCFVTLLLISKRLLDKNNSLFNENIHIMEDTLFYTQLFLNADFVYFTDTPLYHYRLNAESITRSPQYYERNMYNIIDVSKEIKNIINNNKISDSKVYIIKDTVHCNLIMGYLFRICKSNKRDKKNIYQHMSNLTNNEEFCKMLNNCDAHNLPIHLKIPILLIKNKYYKILYLYSKFRSIFSDLKNHKK